MQALLAKNLGSRIHSVESKNQDCLRFPYMDRDQWRIQGRPPPPASGSATGDFSSQKSVLNLVNVKMFNSLYVIKSTVSVWQKCFLMSQYDFCKI